MSTVRETGYRANTSPNCGILYLSYEGMLEPLGQGQVIAYLERLAAEVPIHIVSFEKADDWADIGLRQATEARLKAAGIAWHPLRYHKRPTVPATAFDIGLGILTGLWLLIRHRLSVVHARAYVPAVMALAIKRLTGARYVFDIRCFWPDERVDGGLWQRDSMVYREAKAFERRFLETADHVVIVTKAGAEEIRRFPYLAGKVPPITVIPTCADLDRFLPAETRPKGAFILGYVGAVGNWYDFASTAKVYSRLRSLRPDARMLVVNRHEHEQIHSTMAAAGIDRADYDVVAANHSEVPGLVRTMTAGVLIAKPAYSHLGRSPVKLAEFLGCGVPCLINSGVGDTEEIIASNRVGVVTGEVDEASIAGAVDELLHLVAEPDISDRCRAAATSIFSLDIGVSAYREVYRSLGLTKAEAT